MLNGNRNNIPKAEETLQNANTLDALIPNHCNFDLYNKLDGVKMKNAGERGELKGNSMHGVTPQSNSPSNALLDDFPPTIDDRLEELDDD